MARKMSPMGKQFLLEKISDRAMLKQVSDRVDRVGTVLENFVTAWNASTTTGIVDVAAGDFEWVDADGNAWTALK